MAPSPHHHPPKFSLAATANCYALSILLALALVVATGCRQSAKPATNAKAPNTEQPAENRPEEPKIAEPTTTQENKAPPVQPITEYQPKPPPTPEPAKPQPAPPWQSALDTSTAPPTHEKLAFQDFDDAFGVRERADLSPWFEATSAAGFRLSQVPSPYGQSGAIEGIARLKSPWPDGAVLQLVPDNFDGLKVHFWNGLKGLTLIYHEAGNRWAAYQTTRDSNQPTPQTWAITATDDDRCRRTEFRFGGPIELRFINDELILSRGDVVLLTAPFAGCPSEVFFDGRATIHGIALTRTSDAPQSYSSRSAKERVVTKIQPAALEWKPLSASVGEIERRDSGAVSLRGDGATFVAALPSVGLSEIVLELADISPGVGILLSNRTSPPNPALRFCRDRKTGQLTAVMQGTEATTEVEAASINVAPVSLVEKHCWIRLVRGCGNLRWWVSADGEHWAQTEPAQTLDLEGNESIGISLAADSKNASLTLKQVIVRPLIGLQNLTPNSKATLNYAELEALLDDAQSRGLSFQDQVSALDDASLLVLDLRDGGAMQRGILSRYVDLGLWAADHQGLPAWTCVRQAFHAVPICTPLVATPEIGRAIRWELITTAYRHDSEKTLDLIQRLRLFHQHRDRGLVEWARWRASSNSASRQTAQPRDSWREMLIEDLSKEAYNTLTELRAVLEGEAWDDAARLISAVRPEAAVGVAPSLQDESLLTSVPAAIPQILQQYPQVREILAQNYAAAAKLRISQAIRAGDVKTLELATVQFANLPGTAEAEQWLGDRSLGAGRFSAAEMHYQRALQVAPELREEVAPRLRLAAAMSARDAGEPVVVEVKIGDQTVSAADFERLIAEMRERHAPDAGIQNSTPPTVPKPAQYSAKTLAQFEGPAGERPQEEVLKRVGQLQVSWVDRQLVAAVAEATLYVANRFQVTAYDLTAGKRLWQSETPPGTMQRAQDWPLIPMRPLLSGDRIFIRLLYSANPLLVCLNRSTGKIIWMAETAEREAFASDPLMLNNHLVILSVVREGEQGWQLRQHILDPGTGDAIARRDLVRLRSNWATRSCAQVAASGDGLVATLGGVTISTTSTGDIRWIRKHLTLPAEDDPRWILQLHEQPLVAGERIYVSQPGVRIIQCLDAATGHSHWEAVLPEVVGIAGLTGDVLVVQTETDVRGLDTKDGTTRWRSGGTPVLRAPLCDDRQIMVARREPGNDGIARISLSWLNANDGHLIARHEVTGLTDSEPRLGPIICKNQQIWALFGRGQNETERELTEWVDQTSPSQPPPKINSPSP